MWTPTTSQGLSQSVHLCSSLLNSVSKGGSMCLGISLWQREGRIESSFMPQFPERIYSCWCSAVRDATHLPPAIIIEITHIVHTISQAL